MPPSNLAEVREHGVDEIERLVNLFADFGTSQDNLAADEDEEHNLRLHHSVDETREQLRLVRAEHVMPAGQAFETDRELDIARADDVLNLEVKELGIEAELLDDPGVFHRSQATTIEC